MVHILVQVMLSTAPLLSHCSPAVAFTFPSPQISGAQSALQVFDSPPSSLTSAAWVFMILSPQKATVQLELQVMDSVPVSHCSPLSTTSLPHFSSDLQSAEQPSPSRLLPSSQISPLVTSRKPLPHFSFDLQLALQPSR